jgi:hypothetical protein
MDRTEFEQDLQGFFHNEAGKVEHSEGWWDDVVSTATGKKPVYTAPKSGFFRRKLFLVPMALIVALMVTGSTVYGYSSFLKGIIEGMVPSVENGETGEVISLAQQYDLSQTIDGVTASLEYAYADMNKVVLGVSVEGSNRNYSVRLYTQDGQKLEHGPIGLGSANGEWVWTFDTPTVAGNPSSLNLRVEISVSEDKAPFSFDFEVPYYDGEIINVGQTVEAAGVTIELESLLISPSEIQAIFYIAPQTDERGSYAKALATIQFPDGSTVNANLNGGNNSKGEPAREYFKNDLSVQSGEWIITVTELVYTPPLTSDAPLQTFAAEDTVQLPGPWVFTVQVE